LDVYVLEAIRLRNFRHWRNQLTHALTRYILLCSNANSKR